MILELFLSAGSEAWALRNRMSKSFQDTHGISTLGMKTASPPSSSLSSIPGALLLW